MLDAVLGDASDLRRQISTTDQRKLDEYLDSVRDVEQRIENAGKQGELQGWRPTLDKPNIPRPADGIPQDIAEHMRLMCDILVLGFQTDTTRITHAQAEQRSLVAALPEPGRRLHDPPPAVALRHGRLAEGESVLRRAGRLHRPQARRDPGRRPRTLLDNSMLLFCSSMMTGGHDATQLPVVMLGGGGGKIKGGRVLDYSDKAEPPDVPPLSVDDGQDERAAADKFGDATEPLDEV